MPGMFGGSSSSAVRLEAFAAGFRAIWPDSEVHSADGWVIGAHGFSAPALWRLEDGRVLVSDGDSSRIAPLGMPGGAEPVGLRKVPRELKPDRGNLAWVDPVAMSWVVKVDWSGAFPLYLSTREGEVLFSSHLRPLATVLAAEPDETGCLWFLREGAFHGRRSFFRGIRRLAAGDVAAWSRHGKDLRLFNESELWIPQSASHGNLAGSARTLEEGLTDSLIATFRGSVRPALMMSGGWDSRTLAGLAAACPEIPELLAYCHGDPESRELRLAALVSKQCGFPFVQGSLDASMFDLYVLQDGFTRTENVVFPHWHAAGQRLKALGVDSVTAGVFGEVLGGHYGSSMVVAGVKKVPAVLRALVGVGKSEALEPDGQLGQVGALLTPRSISRPWYMRDTWWGESDRTLTELREDVTGGLRELHDRGLRQSERLIEAYVTQHRAAHYIAAQLLSCRAVIDVGMPFIERNLLAQACAVPMREKIHNRLNREILASSCPNLLRIPLAATLVSAGSPLLFREASRWARKALEDRAWKRHFAAPGSNPAPRFAWANFEFVGGTRCLEPLVEDLRHSIWDRDAIRAKLAELSDGTWSRPAHPMVDMVMKIYTVDLMLR